MGKGTLLLAPHVSGALQISAPLSMMNFSTFTTTTAPKKKRKLLHLANVLNPAGWKPKVRECVWVVNHNNNPHRVAPWANTGAVFFYSKEACQVAIGHMAADELAALRIQQIYPTTR